MSTTFDTYSYLVYGKANFNLINDLSSLTSPDGTQFNFTIGPIFTSTDLNGDGWLDIAFSDEDTTVEVVFGSSSRFPSTVNIGTLSDPAEKIVLKGNSTLDDFGRAVVGLDGSSLSAPLFSICCVSNSICQPY